MTIRQFCSVLLRDFNLDIIIISAICCMQIKAVMAKTVGQLGCHPDKVAKCFVWNTGYQLRHTWPKYFRQLKEPFYVHA